MTWNTYQMLPWNTTTSQISISYGQYYSDIILYQTTKYKSKYLVNVVGIWAVNLDWMR